MDGIKECSKTIRDSYNLCIVGSGPAGIILACEYLKKNPDNKIAIIEYGNEKSDNIPNELDDSLIIDTPENHHLPYECTNKGEGGSSATWGGRCVMYDEIDFIDRGALIGNATWPESFENSIQPFLSIAADYFEIGQPVFNIHSQLSNIPYEPIAENFKMGDVIDSVVERWSKPTRFGKTKWDSLKHNGQVTIWTGWEAYTLGKPNVHTDKIDFIDLRKVSSKEILRLYADQIVVCAGATETTRLLLRNKQIFDQLKTVPPSLGHYYQGHVSGKIASVQFYGHPRKTKFGFLKDIHGIFIRQRFQFAKNYLLQNNLLNTAIWLDNPLYHDPSHRNGAMSFMYLAMITPILGKKLAPPIIADSVTKGKVTGIKLHILNIIKDFPKSIWIPASIFYSRYLKKRKLPGIFLYNPQNIYALHFHAEQQPLYENCMYLGKDGYSLHIHYGYSDEDIQSVITLHQKLDEHLQKCNCGRLKYWFDKEDIPSAIRRMSRDGIHQAGTTRIGKSYSEGVVDENLKVYGTSNMYICSASVFPTSGQANPTFLLGVLAAKLANLLN